MFEVGFTEIVLIFGIALLVLGPARLPKLAADLGRWAGRARSLARQLRSQLEQEVQFDPLAPEPARRDTTTSPSPTIHAPAPGEAPHARAAPFQLAEEAPFPPHAARGEGVATTPELTDATTDPQPAATTIPSDERQPR